MRVRKAFRKGPKPNVGLRTALWLSGLFQQDIAELANINAQKLSHAIYGRRALNADEQYRLANVLRRPVAELFPQPVVEPLPIPPCPPPPEREL
jgi:transcriptional regulator with XRE-family HTH domain